MPVVISCNVFVDDNVSAKNIILKLIQREYNKDGFSPDFKTTNLSNALVKQLRLVIENGIIKYYRRFEHLDLLYKRKFPIISPIKSHFVDSNL